MTSRTGRDSPSCQRAMVQSRSERRFRYGTTCDGGGAAIKACRSARRTTVRATSSHPATRQRVDRCVRKRCKEPACDQGGDQGALRAHERSDLCKSCTNKEHCGTRERSPRERLDDRWPCAGTAEWRKIHWVRLAHSGPHPEGVRSLRRCSRRPCSLPRSSHPISPLP